MDTVAPYTSARCAQISPWVNPLADNEITSPSSPDSWRCRLRTICGSNVPSRSRGIATCTGPMSMSTVLARRCANCRGRGRPGHAWRSPDARPSPLRPRTRCHDPLGQLSQQAVAVGCLGLLFANHISHSGPQSSYVAGAVHRDANRPTARKAGRVVTRPQSRNSTFT